MYAEQDLLVRLASMPSECSANGTCGGGLWGFDMIRAPELWAAVSPVGGRGVVGAVVDSGVDHDHPDLLGQTDKQLSFPDGGYDVYGQGESSPVSLHLCAPSTS